MFSFITRCLPFSCAFVAFAVLLHSIFLADFAIGEDVSIAALHEYSEDFSLGVSPIVSRGELYSELTKRERSFEPYFLSLRFDETHLRSGPGRQYPALWVYRRLGMPLEIVGKLDDWRKVRDFQGDVGWILSNQLRSVRAVIVTLPEVGLYEEPSTSSMKIARLGKDVVGRVKSCKEDWCRVLVGKYDGWARRGGLWGIRNEELLK